jgi:ketosteroid isomerase-like protein
MNELALTYFRAFAAKDLERLGDLLHPDVALRDWVIDVHGRDQVLAATRGIFDQFTAIEVTPLNVYVDGSTVVGELEITLDGESIKVVDVIEYSPDRKIRAIRAYKG